jgi:hypothetical protein
LLSFVRAAFPILSKFICSTCGTEYPESHSAPNSCPICEDERQYVGWNGQEWTTIGDLRSKGHRNIIKKVDEGLWSIITEPEFAIGQRAFLLKTPRGIILWDCITFIDEKTISQINDLGELKMIAISHPHYYSSMVEWSASFGNIPIYLHELDSKHVVYPHVKINYWHGESISPMSGVTLVNLGGHFDGGTVLHYEGHGGVVLSGDIIQVVQDRRWTSFMYSYPNLIPLPERKIAQILNRIGKYKFQRLYSAFEGREILSDASEAVQRSGERYIEHIH